ncbi:MAG TPA: oligosaccharide flippase family protein [Acidimicrobiales bacterium]|nr:oligosaccharide flippase family protein [Acidimicrobiales bacterium]
MAVTAGRPPAARAGLTGRFRALRGDLLVTNSFFIALSNASMGALGFLFWIVAAHLFPPAEVGLATTLVSAAILIGYASLLGFNNTFIRYLPSSARRDDEINTGLILVFLGALVIGGAYVGAIPSFVPQLGFLRARPLESVAIVVFVAFGSVNLVTDAVFVAYRSARYNFLVDGLLQGTIRLALPVALVGLGAFGLFAAFGVASTAAVVASIALLAWRFSYRPRLRVSFDVLRRVFRFGAANYLAEMMTMAPVVALPLIVVHQRGPAEAGYFYLAMSIANMLYAVFIAVGTSLFAEGSQPGERLGRLAHRSGRLQLIALAPAVVIAAGAHRILSVFGSGYAGHGTTALVVLAAASPAVALKHWTAAMLRVRHQLRALVAANFAVGAVPAVLAAWWGHRGIAWVAVAFLAGNVVAGVVGGIALLRAPSSGAPAEPRVQPAAMAERMAAQAGLAVPS